jgi:FHA domain/GAF domain
MPGRLCIHVPDQPALQRVFNAPGTWTIGRGDDCDLKVNHHSVSRRHARLHCDEQGRCRIDDLGSKNGLRVDGQRVDFAQLDSSVWFAIGDVFCEYLPVQAEEVARIALRAQTLRDSSLMLATALEQQTDGSKLLHELLQSILQLSECRRGFIVLAARDGALRVRTWQAIDPQEIAGRAFSGSRSAIERTLTERRAVYLSDARDAGFLKAQASVIGQGIRALASLPLLHDGELLGAVYVDTDDAAKVFTELDGDLLQAFVARAATVLAAVDIGAELERIACNLHGAEGDDRIAQAARSAEAQP